MNRQEAIAELKRMASTIEWDYPLDAQIAIEKAVEALSGPTPDPDTGLVPCGCGGRAKIWPSEPTQFTHVITDYEVGCTECAMTTGWVRGKQENAVKAWNTAMGWKGGSE